YDPGQRWEQPKPQETTFEEAKSKIGLPSGVEWKFVTDNQRGTNYSSDEYERSENSWVAYGRSESTHVFVGMSHKIYRQYFVGAGADQDHWVMKSLEIPVKGDEGKTPAWLYGNVIKALKLIGFKGRFNSKVTDAKDWTFSKKMPTGAEVSIKNWLAEAGEVAEDDPKIQGRKIIIELRYEHSFKEKPGYAKAKYGDSYELIEVLLNGKAYPLHEDDTKLLAHSFKVMKAIFGDRSYGGSKKQLNRMKNGKLVAELLLKNMKHLPDKVREALEGMLAQKK
ncbi:MAG: hypothetical protein WC565_10380, partial [Parcubacteria group bacterium]